MNRFTIILAFLDLLIGGILFRMSWKTFKRDANAIGIQLFLLACVCVLFGITFLILEFIPDGLFNSLL